MSWRQKNDLGVSLVAKVHDQLKVSDNYVLDCGRGFTYWPSDYALTVVSDQPNFYNTHAIFRLHAEIDLARANGQHAKVRLRLAEMLSRAALSTITYDEQKDMYKVHCSIYAHCDNEDWIGKVFVGAVGIQVSKVPALARELEKELGLEPAVTVHPTAGKRSNPDPFVNAIDQFFRPFGAQPSRWQGSPEWHDAYDAIKRVARKAKTDEQGTLMGEFDWVADKPIVLEVSSDRPHPEYGNGLYFRLSVPWTSDPESLGQTAFELNELERVTWNWCHDLGAWGMEDDQLVFNCFVPNISYATGCLTELAHDMGIRARWVNEDAALKIMGVATI